MLRSRFYPLDTLFHYSSPWSLLTGFMMFVLGTGLVVFLGGLIRIDVFWLGITAVLMLQVTSGLLKAYYDSFEPDQRRVPPPRLRLDRNEEHIVELPRGLLLVASITTLTVGAIITVLLSRKGALTPPALIILGLAFFLAFFYGVPPLRFSQTGYGDLTQAFLLSNLIPALAYIFQTGELHRLLLMLTFPLTCLFIAMKLILPLQSFAEDIRVGRRSLLTHLGWQRGIVLHNGLLLFTYAIIGLAEILDQPWSLTWPELLTIPLALFQVFLVRQISGGKKPRWRLINFNSLSIYGLMIYFITLALWTG